VVEMHTPDRYRDRCSCTVLYALEDEELNCRMGELELGLDRRHCWRRGRAIEVIDENLLHCALRKGLFSFFRALEKEEIRFRLGTMFFAMIAAVNAVYGK
jgi:hypothetical protein